MPRESVIGTKIFERVEAMRAEDPKLTQQEAFLRLGTEMDKKPATIGANYYRVMRNRKRAEQEVKRADREARKARVASTRRMEPRAKRASTDRNGQIDQSLTEMAEVMHAQIDTLVSEYKKEHERMSKIREALSA